MPHWDFECPNGHVTDLSFPTYAAMKAAEAKGNELRCGECGHFVERMASRPSVVAVYGFNAANHYGAKNTEVTTRSREGYKVTTKEHTQPTVGRTADR